ncbi:MAG TPA: GNAT family N-acetyltransferase [Trueperaceae bacterium]|nr:GNAT family N-acetyltransferase [Trueperaceae bacterium]
MVELRRITDDNFREVIALELAEGQDKFVAPNIYTLAEAYVSLTDDFNIPMLYAIYDDDAMVGFIAMAYERPTGDDAEGEPEGKALGSYAMYRFMIDRRHQGRGFGRAALAQAIELLRTQPHGPASHIATSFVPGNDVAQRLYTSLGFVETGELDGDELVARYEL